MRTTRLTPSAHPTIPLNEHATTLSKWLLASSGYTGLAGQVVASSAPSELEGKAFISPVGALD
jgi:hypothetical protein